MALGNTFVKTNFGIKIEKEDTPNTYKTPTNILCLERGKGSVGNPEFTKYTCDMMSAYDGDTFDIVTDADSGKVTVEVDIAMPKAYAGMLEDLFLGAGMKQAGKVFSPKTGAADRLSMLVTQLRREYKIKGALAKLKFIMKAGSMVRIQASFSGGMDGDAVEKTKTQGNFAIPKNPLKPDDVLWIKSKCGLTVDGGDYWVSSAEFDVGLDFNTADDFCGKINRITGRKSVLSVTYKNTEENETPLSDLKTAKEYNIVVKLHQNNGSLGATLTIPKATVSDDSPTEVDGYLETTRKYTAVSSVGDDNFSLTFP